MRLFERAPDDRAVPWSCVKPQSCNAIPRFNCVLWPLRGIRVAVTKRWRVGQLGSSYGTATPRLKKVPPAGARLVTTPPTAADGAATSERTTRVLAATRSSNGGARRTA